MEQQVQDPGGPSPDPEEMLFISLNREEVRRALEQLPTEFREAVVLRELEGLSYREIAGTVGVPIGTVMLAVIARPRMVEAYTVKSAGGS